MLPTMSFEDLMLSSFVISNRVWRMAMGHPGASHEMERMVSEKVKAGFDGYMDLTTGLMTGDRESWQDPAGKFAAPGRETLRKNAERLAGVNS